MLHAHRSGPSLALANFIILRVPMHLHMHATATAMANSYNTPHLVLITCACLHHLFQMLLGCRADVLQQVVLGQHQQLSVHVGDDAGAPHSILQSCSLPEGLILPIGLDLQPHLLGACIEEGVAGGVCLSLAAGQQAAGWSDGGGPADWHLLEGCLLITASILQ